MFRVWGLEGSDRDYRPSFGTDVIVGRALNTRTPVLLEDLEYIIFRPYWNVPTSILRGEILPAIKRTPDYLQRHDMEIVAGQSDDSAVVPSRPQPSIGCDRERCGFVNGLARTTRWASSNSCFRTM